VISGDYLGTEAFPAEHGFILTITPNPPPPPGTTAVMILRAHNFTFSPGQYEIYDIGNNTILAAFQLGQVGTDWRFVGLGGFFGNDTTDMLLRNANTGGLEVYNINNNQITGAAFMGTVGLNWQFSGVGFSGRGTSDMLLRNSNTGGLETYNINSNQITGATFIGTVGLDWQFSGVGNFSSVPGESDLLLRNSSTGGLEVYNINNNQLIGAAFIGRSVWIGSSRASPRSMARTHLTWCYATSTPANSRSTTSPTIRSQAD
jgi:hypothetical protein